MPTESLPYRAAKDAADSVLSTIDLIHHATGCNWNADMETAYNYARSACFTAHHMIMRVMRSNRQDGRLTESQIIRKLYVRHFAELLSIRLKIESLAIVKSRCQSGDHWKVW